MKVLKNKPIALCAVVDGFVKSQNSDGFVRLKKFAGKARAPELSATTPEE